MMGDDRGGIDRDRVESKCVHRMVKCDGKIKKREIERERE